jgi:hypothetical protein
LKHGTQNFVAYIIILKGRDHTEDTSVDENIKMNLREIWWEGVAWMHLALGRDQQRAVVNTVMNLHVL